MASRARQPTDTNIWKQNKLQIVKTVLTYSFDKRKRIVKNENRPPPPGTNLHLHGKGGSNKTRLHLLLQLLALLEADYYLLIISNKNLIAKK